MVTVILVDTPRSLWPMLSRACLPLWLMISLMLPLSLKWGKQIDWAHQVKLVCIKHAGSWLSTIFLTFTVFIYTRKILEANNLPIQRKKSCWSLGLHSEDLRVSRSLRLFKIIRDAMQKSVNFCVHPKMPIQRLQSTGAFLAASFIGVALLQWCSGGLRVINGVDVSVFNRNLRHQHSRKPRVRRRELLNNISPCSWWRHGDEAV